MGQPEESAGQAPDKVPAEAQERPDKALDETRAALAPTLEATAAILPWVAQTRKPRFPPETAQRWQAVCDRLAAAWSDRHGDGLARLRPTVFELYAVALELADADCLRLAESLASAADRLEADTRDLRLDAALAATLECLADHDGLESPVFPERARHFAARLERSADPRAHAPARSAVAERLFVGDAEEQLEHLREALALLPPDAYAVKSAASEIARQAETLELDAIAALAGRINRLVTVRNGEHVDLDAGETRATAEALIAELEKAIAAL